MGRHDDDSARRYRDKAEERRTMIPHTRDQKAREILENMAANYEPLAPASRRGLRRWIRRRVNTQISNWESGVTYVCAGHMPDGL